VDRSNLFFMRASSGGRATAWGRALLAGGLLAAASWVPAWADGGSERGAPASADIIVTGFERPESVLHDVRRDVYLVSNITNGPRDTDNTGFISRLAPSGQILQLKFIAGGVGGVTLNAPKGMTVVGHVLHVADIDHLRRFDARTGAPLGSLHFPGATFLNDVTSDQHGNVYVTDIGFTTVPSFGESGTDAVYKVSPAGQLSTMASGNSLLNHPNGVAVRPNGRVLVVNYDPFRGHRDVLEVGPGGFVRTVATLPTGLLDGVVLLRDGRLLVSSWVDFSNATAGVIYLVERDGDILQVASGFQNPSDIGFDEKRQRLLIPELPDPGAGGRVILRTLGKRQP
jgi:sugar lactone lactonase YvrE